MYLFSYGSLQEEAVQLNLYNRVLAGKKDYLEAFAFSNQKIASLYPIIFKTDNLTDRIVGMVFEISEEELLITDEYEGDSYRKVQVKLKSGIIAWCYVM